MTNQLSDGDVTLLAEVAKQVGVDPYKLSRENPFSKSGKVAQLLQMGVAEFYPAKAAEWRTVADGGVSAGTLAELKAGGELSPQAMQDLWDHDSAFVEALIERRQQQESDQMQALEKRAEELRWNRELKAAGGNEHQAKRSIAMQDEANAEHAARVSGGRG